MSSFDDHSKHVPISNYLVLLFAVALVALLFLSNDTTDDDGLVALAQDGQTGDQELFHIPPARSLHQECTKEAGRALEEAYSSGSSFDEATIHADEVLVRCQADVSQTPDSSSADDDCRVLAEQEYNDARESGLDDSKARQRADQARAQCENESTIAQDQRTEAQWTCGNDEGREDPTPPPDDPDHIAVYFTCAENIVGPEQMPIYKSLRPNSAGSAHGLNAAVREYLKGATEDEKRKGLSTAFGSTVLETLNYIEVEQNVVEIDFSDEFRGLPNLGTATVTERFLRELSSTIFQYEDVQQATVSVEDSCETFWSLLGFGPRCILLSPDARPLTPEGSE